MINIDSKNQNKLRKRCIQSFVLKTENNYNWKSLVISVNNQSCALCNEIRTRSQTALVLDFF